MNCPKCYKKSRVTESFSIFNKDKSTHINQEVLKRLQLKMYDCIIRRRKCIDCGYNFVTYESVYEPLLGY